MRGQEATITTLDEPIKLSKDLLWAVEFARVALERTVDELTQKVRRFITDDPPSKETIRQAIFATRIASAHLKKCRNEVFGSVPCRARLGFVGPGPHHRPYGQKVAPTYAKS